MPNAIKYNVSAETLALKKGNFWIGTGDVGKGPTSSTGFYNGITPPSGGYTIYLNKASGGPSIYTVSTLAQLTGLTSSIAGQTLTTSGACLNWFATQTDKMILNEDYPPIITNGLIINLDGGFTPSYPTTGTTWYNTSVNSNNTSLVNGPAYTSSYGGGIFFDGADDYMLIPYFDVTTQPFAVEVWYQPSNNTTYLRGILSCGDIYSNGFCPGWCLGTHSAGNQLTFGIAVGPCNNGTKYQVVSNTTMTPGNIYHLFLTRNTSTQKLLLYVNGILDGSIDVPNNVSLTGNRTSITSATWGYSPPGPYGNIFSTRIYDNKNFSAAEIAQNYCATLPIVTNGLVLNLDAGTQLSYVSGSTAWVDVSNNGNNGVLTNGPTYDSSNLGSIVFDGTNDYVNIGVDKSCNRFTSDFAVCAWVNRSSGGVLWGNIIGDYYTNSTANALEWQILIKNDGYLTVYNVTGGFVLGQIPSGYGANTWINVVLSRVGSNLTLYANNNSISSVTNTTTFGSATGNLNIGIDGNNSSEPFTGKIANVMIYKNKGLTATEVSQNYNAQKGRFGL
jgi:hypothetical protein